MNKKKDLTIILQTIWHRLPTHRLNRNWRVHSALSYSQFGEDTILRYFFPEKNSTYIDIGSGHPIIGNNTYFLYKKGCHGILIDGVKKNINSATRLRPNDKSIQCLVGNSNTRGIFYEFVDSNFSTTDSVFSEKTSISRKEKPIEHNLEIRTLDTILEGKYPTGPTLLNVDVEGNDLNVLRGINWEKFLPRIVCIEEWQNSFHNYSQVEIFLAERGYKLISRMVYSNIYVLTNYQGKFDFNL